MRAAEEIAWSTSIDRRRAWRMIIIVLVIVAGAMILIDPRLTEVSRTGLRSGWAPALLAGVASAGSVLIWWRHRRLFRLRLQLDEPVPPAAGAPMTATPIGTPVTGDGSAELQQLWVATQQRLDYYHQIATFQAESSFRNAQAAMIIGFLMVCGATVAAALSQSTVGGVVVGILGGVGAALAAFISRTFIRAQETASSRLRSYFLQPLEISRVMAAVHILRGVPQDKRDTTLATIAQEIATLHPGTEDPAPPSGSETDKPAG